MTPAFAPAVPLHEAVRYVAGAYVVFAALVVIYLAIMSRKLTRMKRELGELSELAAARPGGPESTASELSGVRAEVHTHSETGAG